MSISSRAVALALTLVVALTAAHAHAAIEAATLANSFEDLLNPPPPPDKMNDPLAATSSQNSANGGAEANATINGSTTSVGARIFAVSAPTIANTAAAAVTESFTYLTDGTASYTLEVEGTVDGSPLVPVLIIAAGQDLGPVDLETLDLLDLSGDGFGFTETLVSGTYTTTTVEFAHSAGIATEITFLLALTGSTVAGSYDLDFANTVTITESSKTDFTAGSGNAYNAAIIVPAPAAAALAPLALVWCVRRSRRM